MKHLLDRNLSTLAAMAMQLQRSKLELPQGGMKPTFHAALGLNITFAFFLCAAMLKAQSYDLDYAEAAFSHESQFTLPLTSNGTVSMTCGDSLAPAYLSQVSERPLILSAQSQRAARMPAIPMPSDSHFARLTFSEDFSRTYPLAYSSPEPPAPASSSAGFTRTPAVRRSRTFNARYAWLNGLQLSLAFADIEATQHCIDEHTCKEGNPLMPSSQAGKLSVSLGIAAFTAFASYRLKKQGSKSWWVAPAVGIAGHAVGLASGLAHR